MRQPEGMSRFEFVVVSSLRAAQLMRGCVPHVRVDHKRIVIAQMEVIGGSVVGVYVRPLLDAAAAQAPSADARPVAPAAAT